MRVAVVGGVAVLLVVLWDAFEMIVLPRRVRRRIGLTRSFYRITWLPSVVNLLNALRATSQLVVDRHDSTVVPLDCYAVFAVHSKKAEL